MAADPGLRTYGGGVAASSAPRGLIPFALTLESHEVPKIAKLDTITLSAHYAFPSQDRKTLPLKQSK